MAIDFSNQYVTISDKSNIASVGTSSFNTTALPKNDGSGYLTVTFDANLWEKGTINSIVVKYKAYGTRTGALGSKAIIRLYYVDSSGQWIEASSHGDVGRGSSNATSYTDTINNPHSGAKSFVLQFKCINPIALQTNEVYVSNISFEINYTRATYTITTAVSPEGAGTVTGGGTYSRNENAILTATPNNGYKFVKWTCNRWSDSTNNPITVPSTLDDTYTAHFEIDKINNILVDTAQSSEVLVNTVEAGEVLVNTSKSYG